MSKEISTLIHHTCFDFRSHDFKPSREYQYVKLHLVYDVTPNFTTNAHLAYDGIQIDPRGLSTRATVIK